MLEKRVLLVLVASQDLLVLKEIQVALVHLGSLDFLVFVADRDPALKEKMEEKDCRENGDQEVIESFE